MIQIDCSSQEAFGAGVIVICALTVVGWAAAFIKSWVDLRGEDE